MADLTIDTKNPLLALLKNKQLSNAAFWKKLALLLGTLISVAPFLRAIFPSYASVLDPKLLLDAQSAAGAIAAYLTVATTGKIGL